MIQIARRLPAACALYACLNKQCAHICWLRVVPNIGPSHPRPADEPQPRCTDARCSEMKQTNGGRAGRSWLCAVSGEMKKGLYRLQPRLEIRRLDKLTLEPCSGVYWLGRDLDTSSRGKKLPNWWSHITISIGAGACIWPPKVDDSH